MKTVRLLRSMLTVFIITTTFAFQGCAFFSASYKGEPMVLELKKTLLTDGRLQESKKLYTILPPADQILSPASKKEAIIFYPGGKVQPLAYLPLWNEVSKAGYTVFVPTMPMDLAVFGVNAATHIREKNQDIEIWHLAGHSLGGAMAVEYLKKSSRGFKSLILLGSYPASDLSGLTLSTLSIKEELGLEGELEKAQETKDKLPEGAIFRIMTGANHAQFGRYGIQKGDGTALLSPEEQTEQTKIWILEFLRNTGDY